jgi:hypothetical protein
MACLCYFVRAISVLRHLHLVPKRLRFSKIISFSSPFPYVFKIFKLNKIFADSTKQYVSRILKCWDVCIY